MSAAAGTSPDPRLWLKRQSRWSVFEIALWLAALAPFFLFPAYLTLASQVAIAALFAVSVDLVLGYAGIITLGHAMFFGLGAYCAGLLSKAGWGEPLSGLVIAGAFAGLAGGLFSHLFQLISPEQLHWQTSAILLVMVVLGGSGSLVGPAIGAVAIVLLQNVVSSYTQRWPSIMAVTFILVVLYARGGAWGFLTRGAAAKERA